MSYAYGVVFGFILIAAYAVVRLFFRVDQGHFGVRISYGKAGDRLYGPGVHFKLPWEVVRVFSAMEKVIDLSGEKGGLHAMTSDGTVLRLDSKLRIRATQENFHAFLFELRDPLAHIQELFSCLLRNEIANFPSNEEGSYSRIRRERRLLNQNIQNYCSREFGDRYGVRFESVDIVDVLPPEELANALNAVEHSSADAETQYARALADSEQKIAAAEKGVQIAESRARASETEIRVLGDTLGELESSGSLVAYLARRRAEVLSGSRLSMVKRS